MFDREILPVAMASFVNSLAKWEVFATHTFSWEASQWSADRVYRRFMRESLPSVSYFYALERNPGRNGFHVHAIWDSAEAPRKATHKDWLERYGRNRIEPIRGVSSVEAYCAKYVCKEGAWWDVRLSRGALAKREKNSPHFPLENFQGRLLGSAAGRPPCEQPACQTEGFLSPYFLLSGASVAVGAER